MCGILGFTKYIASPQQLIMVATLADKMSARGTQSWGTTDGVEVAKFAESIMVGDWSQSHLMYESVSALGCMFAHTRAASHGSVSITNAHPHRMVSDDGTKVIVGVHNGTIQQHSMTRFNKKKFDVDTQMVYDRLVNGQPTDELEGTGVLVYMQNESSMRFLRFNSTNLYVAQDVATGGLVWASTKDSVLLAAKRAGVKLSDELVTKPEIIYEVQDINGQHQLVEIGKQEFGTITQQVFTDASGAQHFFGGHHRPHGGSTGYHRSTICPHCNTLRTSSDGWGLCVVCQEIALSEDNSYCEDGYVYVGHYCGPTEPTSPPPPVVVQPCTSVIRIPQTLSSASTTSPDVLNAYELLGEPNRKHHYKFGNLILEDN